LFCSLKLLFGDVFVFVAVTVLVCISYLPYDYRERSEVHLGEGSWQKQNVLVNVISIDCSFAVSLEINF